MNLFEATRHGGAGHWVFFNNFTRLCQAWSSMSIQE